MKQPEGLDDGSGRVCRLKKAIYGLKQAPRTWYHKLEEALLAGGFKKNVEKGVLRLHQRKYCEGLAEKYGLQDGGKPATPLPSGFSVEPCADEEVVGESDRKLFHSMRLQRGAADVKSGEMLLSCYTDASFNSVKADGTSIGSYVCLLGGGAVSWRSKKQNEVGLSSCETDQRGRLLCDVIICYHILSASHPMFSTCMCGLNVCKNLYFVMIDLEKIFPT
ncbi:hypothetical protein CLOP_g6057 [Closterium sp. NIES-67]|nr:hypothetical protein CLOP_g6057 [Closterium sp. NIES-67]